MADLVCRQGNGRSGLRKPLDTPLQAKTMRLVRDWGNRLLDSSDATRKQLASVAKLASRVPSTELLPLLKRLLDAELRRWREFRMRAVERKGSNDMAWNQARTSYVSDYKRAFGAIESDKATEIMKEYLLDWDFGVAAAEVLAGQWHAKQDSGEKESWSPSPEWSRVAKRRAMRRDYPNESSQEAAAIFSAIEQLIGVNATGNRMNHAMSLAKVAAELPHEQHRASMNAVIETADHYSRLLLLKKLVLSGETIAVERVTQGIEDLLDDVKGSGASFVDQERVSEWLALLPYTDQPLDTIEVVQELPSKLREPDVLELTLEALQFATGTEADDILFKLAESEPRLYSHHAWRNAVNGRGTASCAVHLIELFAVGVLASNDRFAPWNTTAWLESTIREEPQLRQRIYDLLKNTRPLSGLVFLARLIAQCPDQDGLLILIGLEKEFGQDFVTRQTMERLATRHSDSADWPGAFDVLPVPLTGLRRELLAMTNDGSPGDRAAGYLCTIDTFRDSYGAPDSEERHPDIESGEAWPIIR